MDVVYFHQGLEFEWDDAKSRANAKKHGVTFEEAASVFFDPFHQGGDATRQEERRLFIIGFSLAQNLLITIYAERRERIRIISARPATPHERRLYEHA